MKAPLRLNTERLVLRKPTLADAPEIYRRYANDPEVTHFLSWPRHEALDATRAFIQFSDAQWSGSAAGPYLIELGSGLLLGSTGLELETPERAMTGYVICRDSWGRGYATEALRAMIALAGQLGVHQLSAICHVRNAASKRVLEKCRFKHTADVVVAFPNLLPGESGEARRYELAITR